MGDLLRGVLQGIACGAGIGICAKACTWPTWPTWPQYLVTRRVVVAEAAPHPYSTHAAVYAQSTPPLTNLRFPNDNIVYTNIDIPSDNEEIERV